MKRFLLFAFFASVSLAASAQPANVTGVTATADDKSITVSWTNSADPFGRVVVLVHAGVAVDASPSGDGSALTATSASPFGTQVGTGNYTVYNVVNGTPATVTITGLTNGTTYHVKVFAKDNVAANAWNTGVAASATPRPNVPTAGVFSSTTCVDQGSVTFAAPASGSEYTYLVFAKPLAAVTIGSPALDPATYSAPTTDMSATAPAYEDDTEAILVYRGTTIPTSIDLTGLASNDAWTDFHFLVYNVDGTSYSAALTFNGSRAANSTIGDVANFTSSAASQSVDLTFEFPADCFDEVLIVARNGSAPTSAAPVGTTFTADPDIDNGTSLNSGRVVYYNSGTPSSTGNVTVVDLNNGDTYHFRTFVRKGNVWFVGGSISETPTSIPAVVTLNPTDDGNITNLNFTNAVITFDTNVDEGQNGGSSGDDRRTARLYTSTGTLVKTIDRTAFNFSSATVTIPFNVTLTSNTSYYIRIGQNAIERATNSTNWPGISDNTTWSFSTMATTVTPAKTLGNPSVDLGLCYDGNFQGLTDIVIKESTNADFSVGANQSYSILLPSGFIFNPAITTPPSVSGSNISAASALTYQAGNTIARFTYTITGTSGTVDEIRITGLQVKYTGSGNSTGNIVRIGGTAGQVGNSDSDGLNHGTLVANSSYGSTPSYIVEKLTSASLNVDPNQVRFQEGAQAVKLTGTPLGGLFSGSGVIVSSTYGPIFDIPTLGVVGLYPVTYTVRESGGQQCLVSVTKSLEIFTGDIQNLNNQYCRNENPSTGLAVSQAILDARYGPGQTVAAFLYYDINSGFLDLPAPNNTFDPGRPEYAATLAYDWYGDGTGYNRIPIGYRTAPSGYIDYVWIDISPLPTLSFDLKNSFCSDEPAVPLVGVPAQSLTDDFTGTAVTNPSSTNWFFTPSNVPNADTSPQNVDITYNYTDPSTLCSNSLTKSITVYPRPTAIPAAGITPGTTMEICQNGKPDQFQAPFVLLPSTKYNWYTGSTANPLNLESENSLRFTPDIVTTSPSTTTFSVTRTINGCESPVRILTVVVNPTPTSPGADFDRSYCVGENINAADFAIPGTNLKWIDDVTNTPITTANDNAPTLAELSITNSVANEHRYKVSQTISGCESEEVTITATVHKLPDVSISSSEDLLTVCKTDSPFKVFGRPGNGDWSGSGNVFLSNKDAANGTADLNPLPISPGTYSLTYEYEDENTCENSATTTFTILPAINMDIDFGTACDGLPVQFTNNSKIIPSSSSSTIDLTGWIFGDNSPQLAPGQGVIAPDVHPGTAGTYFNPNHIYAIGNYQFSVTMTTSDGCVFTSNSQPITVSPIPDASFSWSSVCSVNNNTSTSFVGGTSNGVPVTTYAWSFNDLGTLNYSDLAAFPNPTTLGSPTISYTTLGTDNVTLTVTSPANCVDDITKPVYVVPSFGEVNETTSYSQKFETDTDGWIAGGALSSWAHGVPAGPVIKNETTNAGNKAWVTNLTGSPNRGEQSWVLSRCFDLTQTTRPIFAMDIWSRTPRGVDGAVLQYNNTGNIENDADWHVIGNLAGGINWYNQQGIVSSPGNQAAIDIGWTGDTDTTWRRAVFKLDDIPKSATTVFRIAFASSTGTEEGFAFDNVFVGERSRIVLMESFTNSSNAANSSAHNTAFSNFESLSNEIVKIQYHTSFPGDDALNEYNGPMNDARTAFYGISNAPAMRIDGKFQTTGAPLSWAPNLYDAELLSPSPIRINVTTIDKPGASVRIQANLENITDQVLDLTDVHVFAVVLEKIIDDDQWLGSTSNDAFHFVAKDFITTTAGIKLRGEIQPNSILVLDDMLWTSPRLFDEARGALAIFVQSTKGTKQVHQAKIISSPGVVPDLVTDAEEDLVSTVKVYPNPANDELNVVLAGRTFNPINLKFIDSFGREVNQSIIQRGKQEVTLSTENLAGGLYILQLETTKGVVRKKVMIVHE